MFPLDLVSLLSSTKKRICWRHPTASPMLLILLVLVLSFIFSFSPRRSLAETRYASPVAKDGGDCEVLGSLRPSWARPEKIRATLSKFAQLYQRRPVRDNGGGMRFDHAFALWYTLRVLKPPVRTVIESGAFKGQGTWIMRQALPYATIFSLDPMPQSRNLSSVIYKTGKNFVDFNAVDWKGRGIDFDHALVFFDDHQSGFRRVVREGMRHGFWRFITEDNYQYLKGDNMSLKWVCELTRKSLWRGFVLDNFGKVKSNQTWEEHLKLSEELKKAIVTYYEFPPVATTKLTGQTRFDEKYASKPLLDNEKEFKAISKGLNISEFQTYTHFSYVETRRSS